jgi:hypothetical protein
VANGLVQAARLSRSSPTVLKARIIAMRSTDTESWIFVYEGKDDVGVYEEWIRAIDDAKEFYPIAGNGKSQVLGLRNSLTHSTPELCRRVLFFIDRDFDGLRGNVVGDDLFCTRTYSVENYLVSREVLRSILLDELRCAHEGDSPQSVIDQFDVLYEQFLAAMADVNLRIFAARSQGIELSSIEDRVTRYVGIALMNVTRTYVQADLANLVPSRTAAVPISAAIHQQFAALAPKEDYRGKFAFGFFTQWLQLVSADRRAANPQLFTRSVTAIAVSPQTWSLRSLASRCSVPRELRIFIRSAFAMDSGPLFKRWFYKSRARCLNIVRRFVSFQ